MSCSKRCVERFAHASDRVDNNDMLAKVPIFWSGVAIHNTRARSAHTHAHRHFPPHVCRCAVYNSTACACRFVCWFPTYPHIHTSNPPARSYDQCERLGYHGGAGVPGAGGGPVAADGRPAVRAGHDERGCGGQSGATATTAGPVPCASVRAAAAGPPTAPRRALPGHHPAAAGGRGRGARVRAVVCGWGDAVWGWCESVVRVRQPSACPCFRPAAVLSACRNESNGAGLVTTRPAAQHAFG
eukprot:366468-Chlamydomonas_euryale.AAC.1